MMQPLLTLLIRRALPLARWGLIWWPPLCIALYVKKEMISGDSLAITAMAMDKIEVVKGGDVDWLASFSLGEQLSYFRGELLWGLLVLPIFSLLLTSGRKASRWRGPILAVASVLLSCLLYAEYGSLRVVGRMLSMTLASDALTFANCCAPMARQYYGVRGFVQLASVVLFTVGIAWWVGRQNNKDKSDTSPFSAHTVGTLGLWGLAWAIAFVAWLPWMPPVRYHTSVLATAVKTFLVDDALDTSAYTVLPLDELARRYREVTHSPDPRPSCYWGAAKDCDVLVFVLETAPARCLPIDGDLSDCPNLARLRERAFVAARHHSTYPLTDRAVFSMLSSWYPSTLTKEFPRRYPDLIYPGLMQSLKKLGYQTALFAPDSFTYLGHDPMFKNLGIESRLYVENEEGQEKSAAPALWETDARRRLRLDRDCLQALKSNMHAWQQNDRRFAALFLPQIGHSPWIDFTDGKSPNDLMARGRKLISMQDAWLGEIVDQLAADGRLDKTLIVVVGDHGTRNKWEAPDDFRPGMVDSQSFHVPLLIYAPAVVEARINVRHLTSHIDIAPSLLDLLGVGVGRDSEQGAPIWDERIKERNTYFPANHLIGADGYCSADGRYGMWNHVNEVVYENSRLHFDTSNLIPKDSPRYRDITQHMMTVFAIQEVWASNRCCTSYGDLKMPDFPPNSANRSPDGVAAH